MFKLLCLLLIIEKCRSARILAVFPAPAYSHHEVFRPFTQELLKRGHEVVVITPYPAYNEENKPQNLTEVDIGEVSLKIRRNVFEGFKEASDIFQKQVLCFDIIGRAFYEQVKTEQVQSLLRDKRQHFDLIIAEAHIRAAVIFSHVYNAPVIQISSFGATAGNFESVGAAIHPILFPTEITQRFLNLTFWEKFTELFKYYRLMKEFYSREENENRMLKNLFGPDTPDLSELMKNVALVLLNIHPLWDFNRPVPPNLIYLGAFSPQTKGNLSKELQSYLDDSTKGVIYVSFGTNVDKTVLSPAKVNMMIEVFSKLPYNVLMTWDDEIKPLSKNIKISNWYPQVNILNHINTKLFITHGGIHSTHEAIAAGVPVIGIPMIFDQWINAEKYVQYQIGEKLDLHSFKNNILKNTIEKVMKDSSYRNNIIKLRSLMFDQPQKPMERAVWWTEFVLRHGNETNLRPPTVNMSWIEYYEIELICLVIVSICSIMLFVTKFLRWFIMYILSKKKKID